MWRPGSFNIETAWHPAQPAIRVNGVSHQFGEPGEARHVQALLDTSLDVGARRIVVPDRTLGMRQVDVARASSFGGLISPTTGSGRGLAGHAGAGARCRATSPSFSSKVRAVSMEYGVRKRRPRDEFRGVAKTERSRAPAAHWRQSDSTLLRAFPGTTVRRNAPARLALARALSRSPNTLLMDEPFGALDEQTRTVLGEDLWVSFRQPKTIVFVTHSLGEAVFLADRVAVFSAPAWLIKEIISVDEPHPRKPSFMTARKFHMLRDRLYGLQHDEIRKSMSETAQSRRRYGEAADAGGSKS